MAQDLIKKAGWSRSTPHSVSVLASFGSKKFTHYRNQIRSKVCLYNLYEINVYNITDSFSMHQYLNLMFNFDNIWWYCELMITSYLYTVYIYTFIYLNYTYICTFIYMYEPRQRSEIAGGGAFSLLILQFSLDIGM